MRSISKLISRDSICFSDYILVYSMRHGVSQNTATHPVLFPSRPIWVSVCSLKPGYGRFQKLETRRRHQFLPTRALPVGQTAFWREADCAATQEPFFVSSRISSRTLLSDVLQLTYLSRMQQERHFYAFCYWSHDIPITVTGVCADYCLSRHVGQKCIFDSIMHTFEWPAKACDWAQNYWTQHSGI